MWSSLARFGLMPSDLLQIGVLAVMFYYVFLFFRGTRGAQVLVGLVLVLGLLLFLTQWASLDALAWLLRRFVVYLAIALLVIFQPEIRRALAELGRQPGFMAAAHRRSMIESVVEAVTSLSEHKIGALIAIERDIGTRSIQESGTRLDAPVVPELLAGIFYPHTPMHDGGVIISQNRIAAAGCFFPLSYRTDLPKTVGTRHRAAVGLTEETDAIVIVVSEETGAISAGYRGRLTRALDAERLEKFLASVLTRREIGVLHRIRRELNLTPSGIAQTERREQEEPDRGV